MQDDTKECKCPSPEHSTDTTNTGAHSSGSKDSEQDADMWGDMCTEQTVDNNDANIGPMCLEQTVDSHNHDPSTEVSSTIDLPVYGRTNTVTVRNVISTDDVTIGESVVISGEDKKESSSKPRLNSVSEQISTMNIECTTEASIGAGDAGLSTSEKAVLDTSTCTSSEGQQVEQLKQGVLHRLTLSDAVFKSQARDEPDLTYEEKIKVASELIDTKTVSFFSRFGHHMTDADLPYLVHLKGHYMVDHCIAEIRKKCDSKQRLRHVRNRRYEAMKELTTKGEFFSDAAMKSRDPLLFQHLVGRHQTEEEAAALVGAIDRGDLRFSSILDKHMDILQDNMVYDIQKTYEESQMEESDGDDESEDEEDPTAISTAEKNMLRAELVNTMQQRFIDGHDIGAFDYSCVDNNAEYDSLEIREVDEQEKYFDEDL